MGPSVGGRDPQRLHLVNHTFDLATLLRRREAPTTTTDTTLHLAHPSILLYPPPASSSFPLHARPRPEDRKRRRRRQVKHPHSRQLPSSSSHSSSSAPHRARLRRRPVEARRGRGRASGWRVVGAVEIEGDGALGGVRLRRRRARAPRRVVLHASPHAAHAQCQTARLGVPDTASGEEKGDSVCEYWAAPTLCLAR
eukprot:2715686-Rhodomonas_salina.1